MNLTVRDEMVAVTSEKLLILLLNDVDFYENLTELGINNICIYGMGKLGRFLYRTLENTEINIIVCVDNNPDIQHSRTMIIPSEQLDEFSDRIDCYIVTSEFYFEEIREQLRNRYNKRIILLRNIIDEMLFMNECYI